MTSPVGRNRSVSDRARELARVTLPPTLVALLIILLWYGITFYVLETDRRFLLPPPHAVIQEGILNTEVLLEILGGLRQTAMVSVLGLAIAFAIGFSMSLVMSQAKWIERSLYPWAVVCQTVPILAIVPLLGFWFGFGLMSRVTVCVIISLFPIVINSLTGLQGADPRLHDLLTLHNANRWTRALRLQIPAARPLIFTGLRTSAGLSVIGAIVGDFFFGRGQPGLGILLDRYSRRLRSEELLTAVIVACLLGVVAFWIFGVIGRRAVGHWDPSWAEEKH
ncbi:MAG: ABC transporter permease [bacterium]|nr:ABC transporter permease [bacterium]MXX63892.1 ABC transporter permease [Acidimicrobiia bacterium]MCY3579619.1 ABC transporter permease [bacterium]MCY3652763.1 ABC transporter permease [bacterium]MDE0643277.1 ABC transporter permease [bacterium]